MLRRYSTVFELYSVGMKDRQNILKMMIYIMYLTSQAAYTPRYAPPYRTRHVSLPEFCRSSRRSIIT